MHENIQHLKSDQQTKQDSMMKNYKDVRDKLDH